MAKTKSKTKSKKRNTLFKTIKLNSLKGRFLVFMLAFALIGGGYYVYHSFAATSGPFTPLYFIKTTNTPNCKVEVHRTSANSNYKSADLHTPTWFSCADAGNGVWQMVGSDLFFIKTKNVASGRIEVHSATAASGYKDGIHAATAIYAADGTNGIFQMVGRDLYFVKTKNTGGTIEVHAVSAASNYQTFTLHSASGFSLADATNGTWQIVGQDLYFIKTKNTGGTIEVHAVSRGSNYQNFSIHSASGFNLGDSTNGKWQMVGQDLYFVKTKNTSGTIEVHAVTRDSNYRTFSLHSTSWFSPADASNGVWHMGDPVISAPARAPAPVNAPKKPTYTCVGVTTVEVASRDACILLLRYGSNGNEAYVYAQMINSDRANAGGPVVTAPVPAPTAPTPTPTPQPAPGNPCPSGGPTLQEGAQGDAVLSLTRCLGSLGYWIGGTTVFNNVVAGMVKDFQGNRGLTCDGIVGPQTYASLGQAGATGWRWPGAAACVQTPPQPPSTDPGSHDTAPDDPKGECHIWYKLKSPIYPRNKEWVDTSTGANGGEKITRNKCISYALFYPYIGLSPADKNNYWIDHVDWPVAGVNPPVWRK